MTKFRILSVWHHDKQPYHIVLHTDVPIHVEDLKKMFQVRVVPTFCRQNVKLFRLFAM